MFSDRLRSRLEQLQHGVSRPVAFAPAVAQRDTVLPGSPIQTAWGPHWQIRQPLQSVWPASDRYLPPAVRSTKVVDDRGDTDRHELDLNRLRDSFPHGTVFLDLETCGFAGSMVFLIGLLHWHAEALVLTQLWARNYAEEKAILQSLWTILQDIDVLVTFNGKSFDWPQIQDRSTLHHLAPTAASTAYVPTNSLADVSQCHGSAVPRSSHRQRSKLWHVDLLHHSRRRWKGQVPNCRLQTLERYICGRNRIGDLPGRDIPGVYHDYVRTGDTTQVQAILHHNALDLVTLLQLGIVFVQSPVKVADQTS